MPSFYVPLAHVASRLHLRAIKSRVIINQLKYFSTTPPPSSSEQSKTTEPNTSPSKSHDNGGNHSESGPGSSKESPSSGVRGPITYFSLALTGLVGASIVAYYSIEKEKRDDRVTSKAVVSTGKPALGGPWSLVDSNGVPRTSAQFHGRFSLLYFGFTHCPDICPSELVKVGKIIDTLGNDSNLAFIEIFSLSC